MIDQLLDEAVHGREAAGIDVDQAKRATDIPGDRQNVIAEARCKSRAGSHHRDLDWAEHCTREAAGSSIVDMGLVGGFGSFCHGANLQ